MFVVACHIATEVRVADAGGFYVREQSTSALASAIAGAAAHGPDASHIFYNPATILDAKGNQLTIDARGFFANADITAQTGISPFGDITVLGDSGELTEPAIAPGLYGSYKLSNDLAIGIGISSPFAVVIETNPVWAGQFQLTKTDMTTININPVVAYRLAPGIHIAGGFQAEYFDADLRKTEIIPVAFAPNGAPIAFAPAAGFVEGDGYGYGGTAGVVFKPNNAFSVGLSYRSHIEHHLKGKAGADLPGVPDDGAKFDVTTPEIVTLAVRAALTDRLTLLAQAEWAGWSRFDGFRFSFASGRPDEIRPQEWRDTWFGAVGLKYQYSDQTELSFGVSHDQAASEGANNTLSPDGDRTLIALGASHRVTDYLTLRSSYAHMFIMDAPINVTNATGTLVGNFQSDLEIVGVSANFQW